MLNLRGIFSIPASSFTNDNRLDTEDIALQTEFSIAAGATAIIGPVIASEVWELTVEERKVFMKVVAEQAAGRVPFVAGVSAHSIEQCIEQADHAASVGANALIAMVPDVNRTADWDYVSAYYSRLTESTGLPVIVQSGGRTPEDRIPIEFLKRLLHEIPSIEYIKDEGVPSNHRLSELVEAQIPRLKGVIGGMGGRYMIDEMRRGACGFAPVSTFADVLVRIWDAFHSGSEQEAIEMHDRLLGMLNIEYQVGKILGKELLRRRGLIKSNASRRAAIDIDRWDIVELEARWARLEPYFKVLPLSRASN